MHSVCWAGVYMCVSVFPTSVILHPSVRTTVSLQILTHWYEPYLVLHEEARLKKCTALPPNVLITQQQRELHYLCPYNSWIRASVLLSLSGGTHNSSQRSDPNYSEEVEALIEPSIMSVTANSRDRAVVAPMAKGSGPDSKKYWVKFFVGIRREGEFKTLSAGQLPLCEN